MNYYRTATLLFLALLFLPGYGVKKMGDPGVEVYNVTHYGAVADGAAATSCDTGEDIPMDCTAPSSPGTDNEAAIEAAITIACASTPPGGVIYIPEGLYRVNDDINVTCSNITIQGDGMGNTVLLPGSSNGQYVFTVCEDPVTGGSCATSTQLRNIEIRDITIRDDDPFRHWCATCSVVTASTVGALLYQEPLSFAPSGATANFYWWSGEDPGTLIYNNVANGTPTTADQITGDLSTETADIDTIDIVGGSAEESHGILLVALDNFVVENTSLEYIGDESIVIAEGAVKSTNGRITNNHFLGTPSLPSAGASIEVAGTDGLLIQGNTFDAGASGGNERNKVINIVGKTGGDVDNVVVTNNIIIEDDSGNNDHSEVEIAIQLFANDEAIDNVTISDNTISLEVDREGTCSLDSSHCDEDSDCVGGEGTICENAQRSCYGETCQTILAYTPGVPDITTVTVTGNTLDPGNINIDARGTGSIVTIADNSVTGGSFRGLTLFSTFAEVRGNTFLGHALTCFRTQAGDGDMVLNFFGNTCSGHGTVGTQSRGIVDIASGTVTQAEISDNVIIPAGNLVTAVLPGIDCNDETVNVRGNYISNTDGRGISDCNHDVVDNELVTLGQEGIFLDTVSGAKIIGNTITGASNEGIECDNCQTTQIIGNTVGSSADPGIRVADVGVDGTSDYNICFGNINLDNGETIVCGDGGGVGGLGDYIGCTDEGGSPDGVNTYCGGNRIGP
jgi:parallel beta-helix repeat protein